METFNSFNHMATFPNEEQRRRRDKAKSQQKQVTLEAVPLHGPEPKTDPPALMKPPRPPRRWRSPSRRRRGIPHIFLPIFFAVLWFSVMIVILING